MSICPTPHSSLCSNQSPEATSREAQVLAAAEKRWAMVLHGAIYEESRQAQRPQPRLRTFAPTDYRHGSSLLQGANPI